MTSLELYHWEPCANSGELLILLHEKAIAFRSHYVDLLQFEQLSPAFLELNPRGQVPVLVHDGRVLTETTLILEYLDAVFPDRRWFRRARRTATACTCGPSGRTSTWHPHSA